MLDLPPAGERSVYEDRPKRLKAQAKQAIRAAAPVFWLVTLVYLLLTEGLSTV